MQWNLQSYIIDLLLLKALNEQNMYCYDAYNLNYWLIDN